MTRMKFWEMFRLIQKFITHILEDKKVNQFNKPLNQLTFNIV